MILNKQKRQDAIFKPNHREKPIEFLGIKHNSRRAFARHFGLDYRTVYSRLRANWSLEDIAFKPVMKNILITYDGKDYSSISDLCTKLKLPYKRTHKRIRTLYWSVKDAVEIPKKEGRELIIKGKKFSTIKDAAFFFGIDVKTLQYRLSAGWDPEVAVDPNAEVTNRKSIIIDGEYFETYSEAARAYNLKELTFIKRINSGWSPEQAAGILESPKFDQGPSPVNPSEYKKRLYEIHGDNLDFSLAKFDKARTKVEVICLVADDHPNFWASTNNLLRNRGCSYCKLSYGERKVSRWLYYNKIKYDTEWKGHGLRSEYHNKVLLRIDFHLPNHKIVIEFDGPQHERPVTFGKMTQEEAKEAFIRLKRNDKRKNEWAKSNGYKMIRINYNEFVSERLEKEFPQ